MKTPLTILEQSEAFIVVDAEGRHIAHAYFAEEDRRHFFQPVRQTKDEARAVVEMLVRASEPSVIPLFNTKPKP